MAHRAARCSCRSHVLIANAHRNDGFAEQKPAGTGNVLIPTARMSGVGDCWPPALRDVRARREAGVRVVLGRADALVVQPDHLREGSLVRASTCSATTLAALRGRTCHGMVERVATRRRASRYPSYSLSVSTAGLAPLLPEFMAFARQLRAVDRQRDLERRVAPLPRLDLDARRALDVTRLRSPRRRRTGTSA